jgi:hypothetical protein
MQGGRVCVRSQAWGSETADLDGEEPERVATRVLERIVRADQQRRADELARQEREMARLRNLREATRAEQLAGDADPVLAALRAIVEQIESSSYFDQHGHPLELDPAFIEACGLVRGYETS